MFIEKYMESIKILDFFKKNKIRGRVGYKVIAHKVFKFQGE